MTKLANTYLCTVKRMQVWRIEVEADNAEAAKAIADTLAWDEPVADDYAYETTATLKEPS